MRRFCTLFLVAFAGLTLSSGVSSAAQHSRSAAPCAGGGAMAWNATTATYHFRLHIGMTEKMYTPAQVKAMHPKTGEVMLGGMMNGGMAMGGGSMRHLEVQICSNAASRVITNASPRIGIRDGMHSTNLPVAMMRGVGAGRNDMHYGNNTPLTAHHSITVTVKLRGETATFHVRVPN